MYITRNANTMRIFYSLCIKKMRNRYKKGYRKTKIRIFEP
jgi:hypothetical protein